MQAEYTIDDLRKLDFGPVNLCVVGDPIAHSLSPLMQNAALKYLAKTDARYADWKYLKFRLKPEEIAEALPIFKAKNFIGINFTVPHKLTAALLAGDTDADAHLMGACNTFSLVPGGIWRGSNTDGYGLEAAIKTEFSRDIKGADIAIIGAGGAARAAVFYAALKGARVRIFNRSRERMEKLAGDLRSNGLECECEIFSGHFPKDLPEATIIVNAAAVGLKASDPSVADFSTAPKNAIFFDMPYIAGDETPSVKAARENGLSAASGLAMLAWQGAKSLSIWTGKPPLGELMMKTLKENAPKKL